MLFSLRLRNETTMIETYNISVVNSGLNFTELWPYTNYSVVAAAINSAGFGPYSVPVSARTMEEGVVCFQFSSWRLALCLFRMGNSRHRHQFWNFSVGFIIEDLDNCRL